MQPAIWPLTIYKGDSFDFFFRVREGVTQNDPGTYKDLTGWTAKAQIRPTEDSEEVSAEFAATIPDQVGSPGAVLLTLTGVQTAALSDNGVWDVQITNGSTTRTYLKGKVKAIKQVTR